MSELLSFVDSMPAGDFLAVVLGLSMLAERFCGVRQAFLRATGVAQDFLRPDKCSKTLNKNECESTPTPAATPTCLRRKCGDCRA